MTESTSEVTQFDAQRFRERLPAPGTAPFNRQATYAIHEAEIHRCLDSPD